MKVLLINPNKWGRGITHLWIASHAGLIKSLNSEVSLFDCTFYSDWSESETDFNTANGQYMPTDYNNQIKFEPNVIDALQSHIDSFRPNIIFVSAISSHIHGEGEYINIELANHLLSLVNKNGSLVIAGGIQPTDNPQRCKSLYPNIDYFISGDSEPVVKQLLLEKGGVSFALQKLAVKNTTTLEAPKKRFSLSELPAYDYSIFSDQTLLRPYNGNVLRAVDYEMSRGCPYSCAYCVETVIQKYYNFNERNKLGVIDNFHQYLSLKSLGQIITELTYFESKSIQLIRCQDTNFLSIPHTLLNKVADFIQDNGLKAKLYIETRPETISPTSIELLKRLNVGGVGMGVETAAESYKEDSLNRFASIKKTIKAFSLLKEAGIKRSAYNILGLPGQTINDIKATISLNKELDPDNITASFYSPFRGTEAYKISNEYTPESQYSDSQLRSNTLSETLDIETLNYYKRNFATLVRE